MEVVRGPQSREEEVRKGAGFVTRIGKLPLLVKSSPGFLVNRALAPYMFDAMKRLAEGTPKEKIDAAAQKFGMPLGPIELADLVGLDVALSVAKVLNLPAPEEHPLLRLVEEKKLGKKTGEGFYKWIGDKPERPAANFHEKELEQLGRDLVSPLIDECEKALADGVVASADHVDAGIIFGTGFAPFRGGPLHYRRVYEGGRAGVSARGGSSPRGGVENRHAAWGGEFNRSNVNPELDFRDVSANSALMAAPLIVMAGLRPGHPENWECVQWLSWIAGLSPAMTVERKFANVFMASSAGGNIGGLDFLRSRLGRKRSFGMTN